MREQYEKEEAEGDILLAGLDEETKRLMKENVSGEPIESRVRHLIDEETE